MKKDAQVARRTVGRSLIAAVASIALALPAAAYQQQVTSAAGNLADAMARVGRRSVAVVDFTDLQGNATELGRFLAEQLSVALSANGGRFETIDRNHLKSLLQEHQLSTTGLIDPQTARKIGQMAGAECLVSGTITPFNESINLSLKLLDTNTAKIMGATTIDIPRTNTINELLGKSVGSQLAAGGTTTGAKASTTPAVTISDMVYGVEVGISQCKRSGRTVGCQGILRNTTEATVMVSFSPFGGVELVDNLANRSTTTARFDSGGKWQGDVEADLPIKFWISNTEVDPGATSLTARVAVTVSAASGSRFGTQPASGSGRETVVLRNIPIR